MPRTLPSVGVEHEFIIHRDGTQVDFRDLIHRLPVPGRRVDPGDRHAYRTPSGLMLTCDSSEAEIATPPIVVSLGFARRLDTWAGAGAQMLVDLLPQGLAVEGCSTHLSVSIDEKVNTAVCRLFAHTFSPALMLLMDDRDSPGLLIRPRHGRVELCAEYVDGASLRAAAMLAVGGVRACTDFYRRRGGRTRLPARLDVRVEPANERFGWYVDREAFGIDLYDGGRSSRLSTADGAVISAQQQLEEAWSVAMSFLDDDGDPGDMNVTSRIVGGLDPLPLESNRTRKPSPGSPEMVSVSGGALEPAMRPAFSVDAEIATWDITIFRLAGLRNAYAVIPRRHLSSFITALRAGKLDASIDAYLGAPPTERKLDSYQQAVAGPALYDEIGWAGALLAPERGWDGIPRAQVAPASSRGTDESVRAPEVTAPQGDDPGSEEAPERFDNGRRFGKGLGHPLTQPPPSEPPPPPRKLPPVAWWIGIGAAALITVIAVIALSSGGGTPVTTAGTATQPTTGTATQPTTGTEATTSTVGVTTTSTIAEATEATFPFDQDCQLSRPDGDPLEIDCPPELAVTVLTFSSPTPGVMAITIRTETGLLSSGEGSISIDLIISPTEFYECFVRGSGEAACRGFAGFSEISVPSGAGTPKWDPAAHTFTQDGFVWEAGSRILTWGGVPISDVKLFLRSRVDPNQTNTVTFAIDVLGSALDLAG